MGNLEKNLDNYLGKIQPKKVNKNEAKHNQRKSKKIMKLKEKKKFVICRQENVTQLEVRTDLSRK